MSLAAPAQASASSPSSGVHTPLTRTQFRIAHLNGLVRQFVPSLQREKDLIDIRLEVVEFNNTSSASSNDHSNTNKDDRGPDITEQLSALALAPSPQPSRPSHRSYTAISYCWNSPTDVGKPIVCDGKQVHVSRNLHAALKQFLSEAISIERDGGDGDEDAGVQRRRFWADAICINQTDKTELGIQVAHMAEIYSEADRVVAWFGPDPSVRGQVGTLFRWIKLLGGSGGSIYTSSADGLQYDRRGEDAKAAAMGDRRPAMGVEDEMAVLQGFKYLAFSGWFNRAWTFQEVIKARVPVVQCGPHRAEWKEFSRGARYIAQMKYGSTGYDLGLDTRVVTTEIEMIKRLKDELTPQDLFPLLWFTCHRFATDPRDKVYAVLGMYRGRRDLAPDYHLSSRAVFAKAAQVVVEETKTLDVLQYSGLAALLSDIAEGVDEESLVALLLSGRDQEDSRPSWVPDWGDRRHPLWTNNVWRVKYEDAIRTNALGDVPPVEYVRRILDEPTIRLPRFKPAYGFDASFSPSPQSPDGGLLTSGLLLGRVKIRRASRYQGVDIESSALFPPCVEFQLGSARCLIREVLCGEVARFDIDETETCKAGTEGGQGPVFDARRIAHLLSGHDQGRQCPCFSNPGHRRTAWLFAPFGAKRPVVLWPTAASLPGSRSDQMEDGGEAPIPAFHMLGQSVEYAWLATLLSSRKLQRAVYRDGGGRITYKKLLELYKSCLEEAGFADPTPKDAVLATACVPTRLWIA